MSACDAFRMPMLRLDLVPLIGRLMIGTCPYMLSTYHVMDTKCAWLDKAIYALVSQAD
jgi:hypothetical protein